MFGKRPPEEDYVILGGKRYITKWQTCKSCHDPIFAIESDFPLCDKCRKSDESRRGGCENNYYVSARNQKKPIPDAIRWGVWERDNFTCKKCGTRKNLTVDHIYPESKGGEATMENCQTLCRRCNSSKGAR